ncbi:hypothetical protein [Hahella sp. HN01]|uniref:hypothetical protein n=1 Tax=Hahella sp. HN01 TaxID=2847262 RepID=UPI001C1E955B|nr:hypothetical protein [Hahella sp. HN01]MBU6953248.1 hypothetical protein [Hahella sp. HN01]
MSGICIRVKTEDTTNAGTNDSLQVWVPDAHKWFRLDNPGCDDFTEGSADWFRIKDYTYDSSQQLSLQLRDFDDDSQPGSDGLSITTITVYSDGERIDHCTSFSKQCPYSSDYKNAFWLDSDGQGNCTRVTIDPISETENEGKCNVIK